MARGCPKSGALLVSRILSANPYGGCVVETMSGWRGIEIAEKSVLVLSNS